MIEQGFPVGTVRPELGALELVINVANLLSGERQHQRALLPYSRVLEFVEARDLSPAFAGLVLVYDSVRLRGALANVRSEDS